MPTLQIIEVFCNILFFQSVFLLFLLSEIAKFHLNRREEQFKVRACVVLSTPDDGSRYNDMAWEWTVIYRFWCLAIPGKRLQNVVPALFHYNIPSIADQGTLGIIAHLCCSIHLHFWFFCQLFFLSTGRFPSFV